MDETVDYESELDEQLQGQRAALLEIQEALAAEPSEELEEMKQQLEEAIRELESSLLEVKKARLLAQMEAAHQDQARMEANGHASTSGAEPGASQAGLLFIGSGCRFRSEDGRWYAGTLVSAEDGFATVSFATPTRPHMLEDIVLPVARLRLLRGGAATRQTRSLRPDAAGDVAYARPEAIAAAAGAGGTIFQQGGKGQQDMAADKAGVDGNERALSGRGRERLWRAVRVTAVDELVGSATVSTKDLIEDAELSNSVPEEAEEEGMEGKMEEGGTLTLSVEDLIEDAELSDSDLEEAEEDGGDDDEDGSDGEDGQGDEGRRRDGEDAEAGGDEGPPEGEEEEGHIGLGLDVFGHARQAAEAGPQTDTAHFAVWEAHSRGIASKLLAAMGYVKGTGLGRQGGGVPTPLEVHLLPQRQGLGHGKRKRAAGNGEGDGEDEVPDGGGGRRKRSQGGARARQKKHAARAREEKSERRDRELHGEPDGSGPGVFSFINHQLGDHSEAAAKIKAVEVAMLKNVGPKEGEGRFAAQGQLQQQQQQRGGAAAQRAARASKKDDRHSLMKQSDHITACQARVDHFQAMLQRNRTNPELAKQIQANLGQAQADHVQAQAEYSRMRQSISGKESQKSFWGKF